MLQGVGALFRTARVRANLSQEELAYQLHICQSDVSKIEGDRKTVCLNMAVQWAKITDAREMIVAFLYGMDGISMLQNLSHFIG